MNPLLTMLAIALTPTHTAAAVNPADAAAARFELYTTHALANPALDPWKGTLLRDALAAGRTDIRQAVVTSYCTACHDWPVLETSTERGLHPHCAAADPRYWTIRPHKQRAGVIWLDLPAAAGGPRLITLNDVGGAIKGRDRFDWCRGNVSRCTCNGWGKRPVYYIALRGRR